jgi:HSP20 family protein
MKMPVKKAPTKKHGTEGGFDLGMGGVFKGLGGFLDLLSERMENGESEVTRTGEFGVKGLGDKAQGIYGVTVRTGIGGPRVERFGNVRSTDEGPVVADVREPLVDLFDEDGEIVTVVELPGVNEGEVKVEVQEDILSLETTGERKFAKEILLPGAVDSASLQTTFRNGILELRLKKG